MTRPSSSFASAIFTSTILPSLRTPAGPSLRLSTRLHFHSGAPRLRAPPVPSSSSIPPIRPATLNGSTTSPAGAAGAAAKKKSGHLIWYREIVPGKFSFTIRENRKNANMIAMLPILLLSTTLFLLLSLSRTHLSSERRLAESQSQITALETQLSDLRQDAKRRLAKEVKERERMLPLVVERVLTKVGAMRSGEAEENLEKEEESRRRRERERALLA